MFMKRQCNQCLRSRQGISLFEVVLAIAIFIGALTAISQILRTGSRAAIRAQLQSEAVLLCERRMNEVLSGVQPLEAVQQATFEQGQNWSWSLNITEGGVVNLLQLEVIVEHTGENDNSKVSYHLTRLLRDPQVYVDAANAASAASLTTGGM